MLLQPAIRDVHHDHVLFTGEEVTGLIDFGAMRIDTPLADVARLVGSLVGDDHEARQFACDAYSELRPLSEADRRLIDVLDETGVVLGALNWLIWLYIEHRDMGPVGPIVKRLNELLTRLEIRKL
ncbi:MAG: phosphotransferase [Planctomycetia bacterium]|nr:phosphotransferase [Planctomycetia bacterium]